MLTGSTGRLKVGHETALTFKQWNVTRQPPALGVSDESIIAARVWHKDSYWSSQAPTEVGLWMGGSWWVWTNVHIEDVNGDIVNIRVEGNPVVHISF